MPSHSQPQAKLAEITPEKLISFTSNELVQLWKDKHGLDIWDAIGLAAVKVRDNEKLKSIDRLEALLKVGELALRLKRASSQEKGGAVQVNVMTSDPRRA